MIPDWDWARISGLATVVTSLGMLIVFLYRSTKSAILTVRDNDIKHIDDKIDAVHDDVKDVKRLVVNHLEWHSQQPPRRDE